MDVVKSSSALRWSFCDHSSRISGAFFGDSRASLRFRPSQKLDLFVRRRKLISFVSLSPSPLSSKSEADVETEEVLVQSTHEMNTVRVKFQLQRVCQFGQQILLVGEDPMLGMWDPAYAVPLDWSDGHVWSVELDMPVGKMIQFKFLLRGTRGELEWQPDPDRTLHTWDTNNTIVVLEEWENAGHQSIAEEKTVNKLQQESTTHNQESQPDPKDVLIANPEGEVIADLKVEAIANLKGDAITDPSEESLLIERNVESTNGSVINGNSISVLDEEALTENGAVPVLVPGLALGLDLKTEEEHYEAVSSEKVEGTSAIVDKVSDCRTELSLVMGLESQLSWKQEPDTFKNAHEQKTISKRIDTYENIQLHGEDTVFNYGDGDVPSEKTDMQEENTHLTCVNMHMEKSDLHEETTVLDGVNDPIEENNGHEERTISTSGDAPIGTPNVHEENNYKACNNFLEKKTDVQEDGSFMLHDSLNEEGICSEEPEEKTSDELEGKTAPNVHEEKNYEACNNFLEKKTDVQEHVSFMVRDSLNEEGICSEEPGEKTSDELEGKTEQTEEPALDVFRKDVHWGRKVLQVLSLGFYSS